MGRDHVRVGGSSERHLQEGADGAVRDEQRLARRADRYAVDPRIARGVWQHHDGAMLRRHLFDGVDVLLRDVGA